MLSRNERHFNTAPLVLQLPLMWLLCVRDAWTVALSVLCFAEGLDDVWTELEPGSETDFNRGMT